MTIYHNTPEGGRSLNAHGRERPIEPVPPVEVEQKIDGAVPKNHLSAKFKKVVDYVKG